MAIPKGTVSNFDTLQRACRNGDVVLLECTDAKTGEPAYAVCAVNRDAGEFHFVPIAKMFNGNPYKELVPPDPQLVDAGV